MDDMNLAMDNMDDLNMGSSGQPSSLQFQSFDDDAVAGDGFGDQPEEEPMLKEETEEYNPDFEYPMYRLNFYRKYFDVETIEVVTRLRRAAFPLNVDFLDSIHSKPDLYGPFWTVTTLVFLVGVCGNVSDRVQRRTPNTGSEFEKISAAASFLYVYHCLCPFLLWLYARTRMQGVDVSLIEFGCLYGYANVIFIPVAILSIIDNFYLRMAACLLGLAGSTLLLYQSLMPVFRRSSASLPIMGGITIGQIGLTASLMFYFFSYGAEK